MCVKGKNIIKNIKSLNEIIIAYKIDESVKIEHLHFNE